MHINIHNTSKFHNITLVEYDLRVTRRCPRLNSGNNAETKPETPSYLILEKGKSLVAEEKLSPIAVTRMAWAWPISQVRLVDNASLRCAAAGGSLVNTPACRIIQMCGVVEIVLDYAFCWAYGYSPSGIELVLSAGNSSALFSSINSSNFLARLPPLAAAGLVTARSKSRIDLESTSSPHWP